MRTSAYSLSIVVPVYNEDEAIGPAVDAIRAYAARRFPRFEIILVESGSTDRSGHVCDALARAHDDVRVIHEGARNGFGSALRVGFDAAEMDALTMITADLPFPFEAVGRAVDLLDDYGAVLSFRASDPRGAYRRCQSVVYNALVRNTLGLRVRHVNSALKVYHRDVYKALQLQERGWLFDVEVVYRLQERQIPFTEIPADLIDRATGQSSVGWRTPFRMLRDLAHLRVRLRASRLGPWQPQNVRAAGRIGRPRP